MLLPWDPVALLPGNGGDVPRECRCPWGGGRSPRRKPRGLNATPTNRGAEGAGHQVLPVPPQSMELTLETALSQPAARPHSNTGTWVAEPPEWVQWLGLVVWVAEQPRCYEWGTEPKRES